MLRLLLNCLTAVALIFGGHFSSDCHPKKSCGFGFIFKLGIGAGNVLNTFKGSFTRDLIDDSPVIVRMKLTDAEMNIILKKMQEINFFDYPDSFKISGTAHVMPSEKHSYEVKCEKLTKKLYWDDCIRAPNAQAENLRELSRLIWQMIKSKPEFKKLPKPRGGYY